MCVAACESGRRHLIPNLFSMAVARVLQATAVTEDGQHITMLLKCRRAQDGKPWRWEVRRVLDAQYGHRKNNRYHRLINTLAPDWVAFWSSVGVYSDDSLWHSQYAMRRLSGGSGRERVLIQFHRLGADVEGGGGAQSLLVSDARNPEVGNAMC